MANNVTFDMSGLDDLEKALEKLDVVAQRRVIKRAARVGMKPVLDEVQAGVRSRWGERSGALHDSVKIRVTAPKNKKWADVVASVGIYRIRPLEELAKAYYPGGYIGAPTLAYWYEYGVSAHSLHKGAKMGPGEGPARKRNNTGRRSKYQDEGGQHPGMPARPVLRQSMDNNVEIVMTRTGNVLGSEIDKALKK